MSLTWSQEAGENLVDIEEFIARDSVERAVRFVDALIDQTEAILADNPRSGRAVPEIGNPDIRELIYRGYRIVYRLNGDQIDILTVFEGHRLLRLNESDD
ncbi:MAG: type II toxin-antitoxin system RelE/ParE family toxin [Desulfuromonadaceae bacterium]|nr:type II toxin-antitoxin system RelE/ParE family toxin [Desulfuromonadaceae bacterium]MDD2848953.1 type II toxin-antitoxin system RelE/ParE family toxin [Desulfuromonadaceae bacterium]MDD4130302.1 type II toxin-antitoxin system RelE/ParE family toxin [Desulfuromonadaceae bacterium]